MSVNKNVKTQEVKKSFNSAWAFYWINENDGP
jgi:hypothetical protein